MARVAGVVGLQLGQAEGRRDVFDRAGGGARRAGAGELTGAAGGEDPVAGDPATGDEPDGARRPGRGAGGRVSDDCRAGVGGGQRVVAAAELGRGRMACGGRGAGRRGTGARRGTGGRGAWLSWREPIAKVPKSPTA